MTRKSIRNLNEIYNRIDAYTDTELINLKSGINGLLNTTFEMQKIIADAPNLANDARSNLKLLHSKVLLIVEMIDLNLDKELINEINTALIE